MTNEEAIKAIKDNYPPSEYSILREALDMSMEALRNQSEWHDLKKDPTDLPKWNYDVLIALDNFGFGWHFYTVGFYDSDRNEWKLDSDVFKGIKCVAWREIPRFKGGI